MNRYLDPTNDVAFKKLFSNKERLIDLLNAILNLQEGSKILDLTYISTEQLPLFLGGKKSLFDLKVKDQSGLWYIIEMQRKAESDYLNRAQLYGCFSYINQIKEGMQHKDLLPVVVISMIGTTIKTFPKSFPYISYHHLRESTTKQRLLYSLTYVFIELGKFDEERIGSNTEQWLHLLKYAARETEPPNGIRNDQVLSAYGDLEQYRWNADEYDAYFRSEMTRQQEADIEASAAKQAAEMAEQAAEMAEQAAEMAEQAAEIAKQVAEIAEQTAEIANREVAITEKASEIANREVAITEKASEIADREVAITEKASEIADREVRIRQREAAIAAKEEQIAKKHVENVENRMRKVVVNMLANGKNIEEIIEITGLSFEEVERLK